MLCGLLAFPSSSRAECHVKGNRTERTLSPIMSPASQTHTDQQGNRRARVAHVKILEKGQLRDARGAEPQHDCAPARRRWDYKSPLSCDSSPVPDAFLASRTSRAGRRSRSHLGGFVELLLQPGYRHGRYAVILAEERSRFCRRVSGGKPRFCLVLKVIYSPAYAGLLRRDLLRLTADPLRLLDDGGACLPRR